MTTILDFLGSDHRACDDLFAAAEENVAKRNWEHGGKLFDQFCKAMERHFAMEEDVLFPAFEAKSGNTMGPTQVMRMEHAQMRTLMNDMKTAVATGNSTDYLGLSETLKVIMQQHNLKEENMLYPMSDRVLAESRAAVLDGMEALQR